MNHLPTERKEGNDESNNATTIPLDFDSPFGSYPNILNITETDRQLLFHPVIIYPKELFNSKNDPLPELPVGDYRHAEGLASMEFIETTKTNKQQHNWQEGEQQQQQQPGSTQGIVESFTTNISTSTIVDKHDYTIGKYDENRVGMYSSEMFEDESNRIDGFGGRRTVHLGIDLSAPVGTNVHAFCDGTIHSVGYNPEYGDYGYVIIIEHFWNSTISSSSSSSSSKETTTTTKVWALYGHLDKSTLQSGKRKPGDYIRKGEIVGRVGDVDENGGWKAPHVHFQLSAKPPDQPHDMPGAASVEDRTAALLQYPDPRYVLGELY
jgi:murein DD-endopeptidase MepM/ murein hydrolase activator NlpD